MYSKAMRMRFFVSAVLMLASLASAAAKPAGPVPPTDLSRLEPAVQRLVRQHVEALRATPEDAGAWADLGLVYEANILWAQARSCFERALELAPSERSPNERLWRFHLAIATQEAGDFTAALDQLRRLGTETSTLETSTPKTPALAAVHQRLGLALLANGEPVEAFAAFSRLIEALPGAPEGYLGAGHALLDQGKPAEAIGLLRKTLEIDPRHRGAHHRLGLALRAVGQLEEARRELALGVGASDRLLPDPLTGKVQRYAVHLTARVDRAAGLLATRRPARAREILELCLADHPDNLTVLNNLAIARLRLGELRPARELLDRALAINPRKFSTWINLTSWALRAGQPEQALTYATGAVERGETSHTYANRAQVLVRLGRTEDAVTDFEKAVALDGRNPNPWLAAAGLNEQLGRRERARDLYSEAIDLHPGLLPAYLGLGRLELTLGRVREAKAALESARAIASEHPGVAELGRALAKHKGDGP